MWNCFSQTLKGDGMQESSSNFIWLSTAFYIVLKIWLLSSIPWLCSPQLQSGPALFPILNSSDSTPSSFSPVRNTIPKGRPAKVSFESSQGPNCSKPFSPFTMYPKHSPSIGEVKSLPSLSCSFQIAAPLSSEFLLALPGFFCSQVHQTTSPVLRSSYSHIDPDSIQALCLVVCPYLLKF